MEAEVVEVVRAANSVAPRPGRAFSPASEGVHVPGPR